ncbi:hypothetical protein AB0I16_02515 [Streptomyces sp. NPDC050703]|uniref:hypothetical protein n=1 Tax=Streptomyces sp. NPDC050703 TaxID=3157218 RepID=UPI0034406AC1
MSDAKLITGGGASIGAAARAPLAALGKRGGGTAIPSQDGSAVGVGVILFLSVVEIVLVDLMLSSPWARLVALAAGLVACYLMTGFAVALSAYPHRLADGALTVSYGASFHARVPLDLISEVTQRRVFSDQQRTAAVDGGVLSLPVMSTTNVVLKLHGTARLEAGKTVGEIQEIRIHATDAPGAVTFIRRAMEGTLPAAEAAETAGPPAPAPGQVPTWLRRLRWAGLLVLVIEILLVTTGLLDWRIAAGILVVTEGTLSVLGLVFGAAFISQYRKLRRTGRGRRAALGEAFYSLLPPPIAEMVRHEVSVWGILALAVTFRTQAGPGERPLGRAGFGWGAGALAALLAAAGITLITRAGVSPLPIAGTVALLYAAAAAAAFAAAGTVRPHTVGREGIVLRWGMHHSARIPFTAISHVQDEERPGQRPAEDGFRVPGRASEAIEFHFREHVEVPARLGALRPVTTLVVPVADATAARALIDEHQVRESR